MMQPPFKITVCGLEELPGHSTIGVSHILSILDPEFPVPDAFDSYGAHERLELRFHDIIEEKPGMLAPQPSHVERLLAFGRSLAAEPAADAHLLVHCHAGISRSTASLTLMVAQAAPDRPASEILSEILGIRPIAWPNLRIIEMGDRLLSRDGELIRATRALYGVRLRRQPDLAATMIAGGREREVRAATPPAPG
ncbi:MAG TPA: protein-tyrosine-phosphatase [Acetobacteraceae bacterium]|nr:protein-tyrosine-phosphatase [Acetobacteraceae bacterium]